MPRWTPQQEAVFEAVHGVVSHVLVQAVAGAGKTSTIVEAAQRAPGKSCFVCFNKHIATELQNRLNGAAQASTLHALGYRSVRRAFPGVELDEKKPQQLLRKIEPDWFYEGKRGGVRPTESAQATLALARLTKYTLTNATDPDALAAVVEHYGVDMPPNPAPVFGAVARLLEATLADTRRVDFDDQLWLPVQLRLPVETYDNLLIDECQDLSRLQQALAFRAAPAGRIVPVGDPRQAINGFAGADPQSVPRLAELLTGSPRGLLDCPLTTTFRCPRKHVSMAQHIIPRIEAAEGAADGEVLEIGPSDVRRHVSPGDLVIARRNAPLLELAFQLIADGVPVLLRGRDIGKGLLDLVYRLEPRDPVRLLMELELHRNRQLEKLERKDAPESQFQALHDRVTCLKELASQSRSVQHLVDTIRALFADESDRNKVVLSSIHRSKGLEADKVIITDTENLPMTRACRECRGAGCSHCGQRGTRSRAWEVEQEMNLAYVAVTRAKKELIFAGPVPAIFGGDFQ
jgi:DNA helicase-2/ATP-dependent DNA helicase PcrA